MSFSIAGKTAIVTGAANGIGLAIARQFAEKGANVMFADMDETRLVDELGEQAEDGNVRYFAGDLREKLTIANLLSATIDAFGQVDVLVNAVGPTRVLPVALLDGADWDELNRAVARSTFVFSRAALRPMIRARSGRILNIGSFAVQRIVDGPVHYAAAKGAVVAFTRSLAREVGRYGITVNCLSPGLMSGGISAGLPAHRVEEFRSQCALGRLGEPDELAGIALFMVDTPFMTGVNLVADGGL